jgi:hypothetical protein
MHSIMSHHYGGGNGFRYDTWLLGYSAFIRRILMKNLYGCEMGPVVREGLVGVHEAGTQTHSSKFSIYMYVR